MKRIMGVVIVAGVTLCNNASYAMEKNIEDVTSVEQMALVDNPGVETVQQVTQEDLYAACEDKDWTRADVILGNLGEEFHFDRFALMRLEMGFWAGGASPFEAAQNNWLNIVKLFIRGNKDIVKWGDDANGGRMLFRRGDTMLHYAVRYGHKEMVELLISKGADVNKKTNEVGGIWGGEGEAPLHYAAKYNFREIAEILLNNGAEIELEDRCGNTALHYAVQNGSKEVEDLLKSKGAIIKVKTSYPSFNLDDTSDDSLGSDSDDSSDDGE